MTDNRIFPLIILISLGCNSNKKIKSLSINEFKTPVVIQDKKINTTKYFREEALTEVWPKFVGQFSFADSIHFTGEREQRKISSTAQYLWEQKVYVFDTLSSDGLQIRPDYETSIACANDYDNTAYFYYPVYIVNETMTPKLFIAKDQYVFGIQEAADSADFFRWHPIESRGFDFCGNGYFRRKVLPGEFIMCLFPKYAGSGNVMLRIRMKIGDDIIVSKPFKGLMNPGQFKVKKGGWVDEDLKETNFASADWLFYGGILRDWDK